MYYVKWYIPCLNLTFVACHPSPSPICPDISSLNRTNRDLAFPSNKFKTGREECETKNKDTESFFNETSSKALADLYNGDDWAPPLTCWPSHPDTQQYDNSSN